MQEQFWNFLKPFIPRLLGQIDRDPDSPSYGSFDRNFWHYKIRDFSSIILQQGLLVIDTIRKFQTENNPYFGNPVLEKFTRGGINFWFSQQLKDGSFNEYYPYEHGFPPTAFSLYTIGLLFKNNPSWKPDPEIKRSIQKSVNRLLKNPEKEALNQQAAALAGIALCSDIKGISVDKGIFEKHLAEFFSRQSSEGWFPEYGGPDTGYLSVTIDCLYDYYEITNDERAWEAMEKAVNYIFSMMSVSGDIPAMINSRNTDYLVPYGLARLAHTNQKAAAIISTIIKKTREHNHYLYRTDDRYLCHYVFQSCFRSLPYLDLKNENFEHHRDKKKITLHFLSTGETVEVPLR